MSFELPIEARRIFLRLIVPFALMLVLTLALLFDVRGRIMRLEQASGECPLEQRQGSPQLTVLSNESAGPFSPEGEPDVSGEGLTAYDIQLARITERQPHAVLDVPLRTFGTRADDDFSKAQRNASSIICGRIALVNFWFSTCSACQKEEPVLTEIVDKFAANDRFFYLSVTRDARPKDVGLGWPSIPHEIFQSRGGEFHDKIMGEIFEPYPLTVLLDHDGRIQLATGAVNEANRVRLENAIARLLAEPGPRHPQDCKASTGQLEIETPDTDTSLSVEPEPAEDGGSQAEGNLPDLLTPSAAWLGVRY